MLLWRVLAGLHQQLRYFHLDQSSIKTTCPKVIGHTKVHLLQTNTQTAVLDLFQSTMENLGLGNIPENSRATVGFIEEGQTLKH